jgi:hypothetical protein
MRRPDIAQPGSGGRLRHLGHRPRYFHAGSAPEEPEPAPGLQLKQSEARTESNGRDISLYEVNGSRSSSTRHSWRLGWSTLVPLLEKSDKTGIAVPAVSRTP